MLKMTNLVAVLALAALPGDALAEDAVGDWVGKVKVPPGVELTIATHIAKGPAGLQGYAESPDQTVTPLPMADIVATSEALTFTVPSVQGVFKGKWDPAAKGWVGVLSQSGLDMPLTLVRGVAPPRSVVAGLDGEWQGMLAAPQADLRLRMGVKTDANGTLALFQSPDQSPQQIVAKLTRTGDTVTVDLPGIGGFEGKLSPDGKTLDGAWRQGGGSLPLTLKRGGG